MRHEGKAALVTGAAQGIGRAIAERLLADGAWVTLVDRNPDTLGSTVAELGPSAHGVVADVSVEADCAAAVASCMDRFGRIDILAAHAGIAEARPFLDIDAEHWRRHQAVNVDGALYCAVHAARINHRHCVQYSISNRGARLTPSPYRPTLCTRSVSQRGRRTDLVHKAGFRPSSPSAG